MAQVCEICGKGPQFGNNISHAHNVSKRRWKVNLRAVRARVKGGTSAFAFAHPACVAAKSLRLKRPVIEDLLNPNQLHIKDER